MKTFFLPNQDNTIGMLLNEKMQRDPRLEFASCFVRHPDDSHLEVKVQVSESLPPSACIQKEREGDKEGVEKTREESAIREALREIGDRFDSLFVEALSDCDEQERKEIEFMKAHYLSA